MPPMKEASPDVGEEDDAIGTAVPEPSFGWLPDPAAQIRSSVSGAAAQVATAAPAPHSVSNGAAEHESRAAGPDGRPVAQTASRMEPPAKQLRRGFLDRPRKRLVPTALDTGGISGTATPAGAAAASAEDRQPAVADGVSGLWLEAVGNGTAAPVADDAPPPAPMAPMPISGPERARRDVFRQLQPLCSALLPLRADAGRLAPALRALEGELQQADPLGLQARLIFVLSFIMLSGMLTRVTHMPSVLVSSRYSHASSS